MSAPDSQAVFLSYASEDAAAARRICESLRTAGVEVWFDQNELVGGDAWDAKIRKQIGTCALFVPILSASTQARLEGYFRLEWKLAAQRTHTMAEEKTFLLPVVIDATRDADAKVPAEFKAVQWTRLPDGETTPAFVARVQQLLGLAVARVSRPVGPEITGQETRATPQKVGRRVPAAAWLAAATLLLVAIAGASLWLRRPASGTPPSPDLRRDASATTPPAVSDKSIAVLPFANLSDDKDNNAFFADGIHDDILTGLAVIRELRVVSRTSVMEYRGTTKKVRQIAQELGVAYILEGSVRRSGSTVRVTGQLIRAATDEHVWAENYTKSYTATDVFAIQSELAQKIAAALSAALSPQEKTLLARKPTENSAAYELYLKGRDVRRESRGLAAFRKRETLFQAAVELDPQFAEAWGELAVTHTAFLFDNLDKSPTRLAKAQAAIDRAVELAPDSLDVIRSLADFYLNGTRDVIKATEQLERLVRLSPNDPSAHDRLSVVQYRRGLWSEALATRRKSIQLDRGNLQSAGGLVSLCETARRYDEAMTELRRMMTLRPGRIGDAIEFGQLAFYARGSTRETNDVLARLSPQELNAPELIGIRKDWAVMRGDLAEASRLDRLQPYFDDAYSARESQAVAAAMVLLAQNNRAGARARLESLPAQLRSRIETEPTNEGVWRNLALMEAILENPSDALRYARKAVEVGEAMGPIRGARSGVHQAIVYAWTGDKDRAIAELARLLKVPAGPNVHVMRSSPNYAPLRGDPRFEALLNDPKNNAPLF
ncbi:MAG: TIR domain-containing protein [Verrucomicrobia bacterium]|nr:TIR domain-containing protein [Verrucomicrobiota bacterium]